MTVLTGHVTRSVGGEEPNRQNVRSWAASDNHTGGQIDVH
jgi:hypothetical protein